MNSKVKGFTVIELLVTLILTGIVTGMSFLVFTMFTNYYNQYQKNSERMAQVSNFYQLFTSDFYQCQTAELQEGNHLIFKYNNGKTVKYELFSDEIIRHQLQLTDTFQLKTVNRELRFDQNLIDKGYFDELVLDISNNEKNYNFTFVKEYAADIYMYRNE